MYSLRLVHSRMILEGVQMIIIQILMRQIIQMLEFSIHMKYLEILIARLMKITIKIENWLIYLLEFQYCLNILKMFACIMKNIAIRWNRMENDKEREEVANSALNSEYFSCCIL